ncbi:MAG: cobyrinate a,c-diamide synthase [Thermodesulfobacteriota bacterium]
MAARRRPRGLVIAAPASSSGKTVVALGLMEALRRRGLCVQPFKAGPDYIDPGLHAALLGRPSYNLDTWMMGTQAVVKTFSRKAAVSDVSVVEGVMGLFDGRDGRSEEGSTAHLAKTLGLPVLLVVNAEKAARSVGAVIKGFTEFDPGVEIRWVVFNRVASPRHYAMLRDSVPKGSKVRVLGCLPKDPSLCVPERHLGLFTASTLKRARWDEFVDRSGSIVEECVDIDALLKGAPALRLAAPPEKSPAPAGPRIAVARDRAFCFYYEENFDILRSLGAVPVPFSPMRDRRLPDGVGGVYIGGGYPELFASALERNVSMREDIKRAASGGLPVLAECGGLMYLGRSIEDARGRVRAGAGVFPWASRMSDKRAALGYREVVVQRGCPLFEQGGRVRGHEFHYSVIPDPPARIKRAFTVRPAGAEKEGRAEGYMRANTLASYVHIHFASNPAFAGGFVRACEAASARRGGRRGR